MPDLPEAEVVVDGGMHHQLAASGNFGCLCTPLNLLGDDARLADAQIGDSMCVVSGGRLTA